MYDEFRHAKTRPGKILAFVWCTFKLLCYIAFWVIFGVLAIIVGCLASDPDTKIKQDPKPKTVTRYVPIYKHDDRW